MSEATVLEKVLQTRNAAEVKRYHNARTIREQTLAHHSYGVAMLLMFVTDPQEDNVPLLLAAALTHDLVEFYTGDIPAPAKWMFKGIKSALRSAEEQAWMLLPSEVNDAYSMLTDKEKRLLKFCDWMEGALWCYEEVKLGNTYAAVPLGNFLNYLASIVPPNKKCDELIRSMIDKMFNEEGVLHVE